MVRPARPTGVLRQRSQTREQVAAARIPLLSPGQIAPQRLDQRFFRGRAEVEVDEGVPRTRRSSSGGTGTSYMRKMAARVSSFTALAL